MVSSSGSGGVMGVVDEIIRQVNVGFRYIRTKMPYIGATVFFLYYVIPLVVPQDVLYNLKSKIKSFINFGGEGSNKSRQQQQQSVVEGNGTASSSTTASTGGGSTSSDAQRREEMLRIRMQQQEILNERAKEAEKLRKEKLAKERERKNAAALHQKEIANGNGNRLGGDGTNSSSSRRGDGGGPRSTGFNPMQPWNSGSGGYRPQRRTVNRGGG